MKENSALIAFVLDRSGSMSQVWDATIQGFNEFLEAQKMVPGECFMYLTQFDTQYDILERFTPLKDVPPRNHENYVPRGSTALLDAVGRTVNEVGADLANRSEDERPAKVIFVIQSDGFENASQEFKKNQVKEIVERQRNQWQWEFMFLAANMEAFTDSPNWGMQQHMTAAYASTPHGTANAMASAGANVTRTRTGDNSGFTPAERDKMKQE